MKAILEFMSRGNPWVWLACLLVQIPGFVAGDHAWLHGCMAAMSAAFLLASLRGGTAAIGHKVTTKHTHRITGAEHLVEDEIVMVVPWGIRLRRRLGLINEARLERLTCEHHDRIRMVFDYAPRNVVDHDLVLDGRARQQEEA